MKKGTVWVVYLSPAGTTRQVAEMIADEAERLGRTVNLHDLAGSEPQARIRENLSPGDILFAGSPVYAHHPVPQVSDFLAGLPESTGVFAAPFVTYGCVASGVALHDMALALDKKGLGVLGGIKVLAQHSMLWHAETPLGQGHPDSGDEEKVREFVRTVLGKTEAQEAAVLSPEALNYQGELVRKTAAEASLTALKSMFPPLELDAEACTQCGVCADACPAANITLSPDPVFGDRCILCFNCVRLCEPGAVTHPVLAVIEPEIHKRQATFNESQETRFFV
jgi:ferredoxin/flavodoxin